MQHISPTSPILKSYRLSVGSTRSGFDDRLTEIDLGWKGLDGTIRVLTVLSEHEMRNRLELFVVDPKTLSIMPD